MTSAYFIAQEKNKDRFGAIFESCDVAATTFDAAALPSLTAFVTRDRAIADQPFVVIDVGRVGVSWSLEHIVSAIVLLKKFSNTTPILIGEPDEDLTELFDVLANRHRLRCLITDHGGSDACNMLKAYLTGKEMSFGERAEIAANALRQAALNVASPKLDIPHELMLSVTVAGTMQRCGTTTQAFAVWHYLKSLGFHPLICDRGGVLISLLKSYGQLTTDDGELFSCHGIDISASDELPEYNAFISDCGVLTGHNVPRFCDADISVLVCCTKPWEYKALGDAVALLMGKPFKSLVALANLSAEEDFVRFEGMVGEHSAITPYNPYLWRRCDDDAAYAATLLPVVRDLIGAQHKASPHPEPEME